MLNVSTPRGLINQSYKTVLFLPIAQIVDLSCVDISAKYTNYYEVPDFSLPITQTVCRVVIIILPIIQMLVMVLSLQF